MSQTIQTTEIYDKWVASLPDAVHDSEPAYEFKYEQAQYAAAFLLVNFQFSMSQWEHLRKWEKV